MMGSLKAIAGDAGGAPLPPGERPMRRRKKETEEVERKKAQTLFEQFDLLYLHRPVEEFDNPPYPLVLHRFLAADVDFAYWAREIGRDVWDSSMVLQIWRAVVPKMVKSPYMKYTAPKKPASADAFTERLMKLYAWSRQEAEEAIDVLLTVFGEAGYKKFAATYGVEVKEKEEE